jgi:hypothetical protein
MTKRSVIEGRIGTSKRKYRLDRILTKQMETSRTVISMAIFVMNAEKILRLLRLFFCSSCVYVLCDALYVRVMASSSASMGYLGSLEVNVRSFTLIRAD